MSHQIKNKKINEAKTWAYGGATSTLEELPPDEPDQDQKIPTTPPKQKVWKMKGGQFEILPLPEVLPQKEEPKISPTVPEKKCATTDRRFQKSCPDNNLSKSCGGQNVQDAQKKLIEKGFNLPKFGADCRFGNETTEAVKKFQTANDLPSTGVIDQATHDKLFGAAVTTESKIHNLKVILERNEMLEKLVFEKLVK